MPFSDVFANLFTAAWALFTVLWLSWGYLAWRSTRTRYRGRRW